VATPRVKYIVEVVDRASAAFKSISAQVGRAAAQFGKLASAAVVAGLTKLTIDATKSADEVNKLSTQLGISTRALSEYQFVAQQTGVTFQAFTLGIQRSTRRIAEAAVGTGEAQRALRELGLDAEALTRLSPDQQFEVLARALNGVENEATQLRLAFKLFDTEGVRLLRTIKDTNAELGPLRERARDLGLSLDQGAADAATRAVDAFGELKGASVGLGRALSELATAGDEGGVVGGVTNFIASLTGAVRIMNEAESASQGLADIFVSVLTGSLVETAAQAERTAAAWRKLQDEQAAAGAGASGAAEQLRQAFEAITVDADRRDDRPAGVDPVLWREAQTVIRDTRTPLEEYSDAISRLKTLQDAGAISSETYNRAVLAAATGYRDAAVAAAGLTDAQSKADEAFEEIGSAASSTVGDLVRGFAQGTAEIGDLFERMAARIIEKLFEIFVVEQLVNSISSSFGFGGGARQLGGPVFRGQPVLVGERGPELFVPQTGGTISPNAGGPVNVNFQVNSLDPTTAASVIVENRQVIVGVISAAFERNGRPAPIR
jgi:hypothetical protein